MDAMFTQVKCRAFIRDVILFTDKYPYDREFIARRSAFGTRLCLSMRVLAGVEMPSKREIMPNSLVAV